MAFDSYWATRAYYRSTRAYRHTHDRAWRDAFAQPLILLSGKRFGQL